MQAPKAAQDTEEEKINKGIIYLISDKNNNDMFYIGSTKQILNNRISTHKKDSKKKNSKLYLYIRNVGDITTDFNINILDEVEFYNIQDLREKEKYYINSFVPPLNSNKISNFDVKDKKLYNDMYYQTEKRKNYMKNYYINKKNTLL